MLPFEAYAVLEIGVPNEVVDAVSSLTPVRRKSILASKYLSALLREEGYGRKIYHSILSDHILAQIDTTEVRAYHRRAADYYRERLMEPAAGKRPLEDLAATRLPDHACVGYGPSGFVHSLINESSEVLTRRALHAQGIDLCRKGLTLVERGSEDEGNLLIVLANIHDARGELRDAERELLRVITTGLDSGRSHQLAIAYGNLGVVYQKRGELEKARNMHEAALKLNEALGRPEAMAGDYINLAILSDACGDHSEGESMIAKAREVASEVSHKVMVATYVRSGLQWKEKGYPGLMWAESTFREALKISERSGDVESTAAVRFNLGSVLCPQGKLTEGLSMLDQALRDYKCLGDNRMTTQVQGLLESMNAFARRLAGHFTLLQTLVEGCEGAPPENLTLAEIVARGLLVTCQGDFEVGGKWLRQARDFYLKSGLLMLAEEVARMIEQAEHDRIRSGPANR